jgi:hypothetical protein
MTQGRSAGLAFRVRITVNHRLVNMLGQKPWGKELPTTVGQRLAIILGQLTARRVPWRAGGITGIRDRCRNLLAFGPVARRGRIRDGVRLVRRCKRAGIKVN